MIFSANIFRMIVRERRVADRGRAASRALRNCGLCNTASGEILALAEGAVVLESVQRHRGARELSSCCVVWTGCLRFVPGPP